MKTGAATIRCALPHGRLVCGMSAADERTLDAIDTYGKAIGLAFQIVDDILDVTATEEQMGKKTGKDAAIGKLTYPVLVGLDGGFGGIWMSRCAIADRVANELGPHAVLLSQLAHDLANRTN